jgi:ribosomal protein S15P/S13E
MPKKALTEEGKSEEKNEEKHKKLTSEEYEKKVIDLANKGLTSEKIGEELKKQNIHSKEYSKKISQILGEKNVNPDLKNIEEKLKNIEAHMEKNPQDKKAMRERSRVFSQVRKVKKYLKKL